MFRRFRSARSGQFVSEATADAAPDTTVSFTPRSSIPADVLGRRLAYYADKGSGTNQPGEAYAADPAFWDLEAARLNDWLHGATPPRP